MFQINKTDHLPKNICHICMSFISDFDEYRKNCRIVQTKMSNLARNFNQVRFYNRIDLFDKYLHDLYLVTGEKCGSGINEKS